MAGSGAERACQGQSQEAAGRGPPDRTGDENRHLHNQGGRERDVIVIRGGATRVNGGDGRDLICAGRAADVGE